MLHLIKEYSNSSRNGADLCEFLRIKFAEEHPTDLVMEILNDAMICQVGKCHDMVDRVVAQAGKPMLNRQHFWFRIEQVSSDPEDEFGTIPAFEALQNHFDWVISQHEAVTLLSAIIKVSESVKSGRATT